MLLDYSNNLDHVVDNCPILCCYTVSGDRLLTALMVEAVLPKSLVDVKLQPNHSNNIDTVVLMVKYYNILMTAFNVQVVSQNTRWY